MRGLLAGLERKNGWTLAEHAGAVSPDGMQRLLRTADWDVEGVRDDVRGYVLDHLGDPASGVFVVDETGFIKKGRRSAGVQRQYTGTTGKIDNCQLGVFLAYASVHGSGVDRPRALPAHLVDRGPGPLRARRGFPPSAAPRLRDQARARASPCSTAPTRPGS